ncbi:MAG: hypothetical protein ABGZ53_08425 [Fuerstiella sp.]
MSNDFAADHVSFEIRRVQQFSTLEQTLRIVSTAGWSASRYEQTLRIL